VLGLELDGTRGLGVIGVVSEYVEGPRKRRSGEKGGTRQRTEG